MMRDKFADMLDGREFQNALDEEEAMEAKACGLLIAFAAGDDSIEFHGLVSGEIDVGDDAKIGILHTPHQLATEVYQWMIEEELDDEGNPVPLSAYARIHAEWRPTGFEGSWRIRANVPHAVFDIMEDGERYCQGVVIAEADLYPPKRVLGVSRVSDNPKALLLSLTQEPGDGDLRLIQDVLSRLVLEQTNQGTLS